MNKKGIVLSGLIYALLVFFLLLLVSLLTILWYRQNALVNLAKDANELYESLTPLPLTTDFIYAKGVNKPKLGPGMVPVKWNGIDWDETSTTDLEWYDYRSSYKKWANAMTQDGSMWVWIPRYAYSISSGYHTSTASSINIKFLIDDTNTTTDGTAIETAPNFVDDAQTNYALHPSFNFGGTQLTGMWVAKFEASDDGVGNVKIIPDAVSWRGINVNNAFNKVRSMETNNVYGWGTTGSGIDTHMMKNTEWGAVAYLTQSLYGKNAEVWINPANNYTTGCAGGSVSSDATTGCINSHKTANGQQASTTGNIYGIYDMSGGAWEYVMGNINDLSGNSGITDVAAINNQYIDRYTGYNTTINGDAVYETSNASSGSTSWYADYSNIPDIMTPWFLRGGYYGNTTNAGIFSFYNQTGENQDDMSFRPIILVDDGL